MIDVKGPFRVAALGVAASGIVHILAPLFSNFTMPSLVLVLSGVLYLGLAYGLLQGSRLLAYLVFVIMIAGSIFALASAWTTPQIPVWIFLTIAALDWLAVIALLPPLWRPRPLAL